MPPAGLRAELGGAPSWDQARTVALPGLAGTTAVPASSAPIARARAFRAWLEPLIPSLRRARLDTGLPAAASLLAAMRARPVPDGIAVAALASWSCCGPSWSLRKDRSRPGGPGVRPGPGPHLPSPRRRGRGPRYCWPFGSMVRCVRWGAGIGAEHVGQRGPMARTRTGRQDTKVVMGHDARAAPAWASR